MRTRAALTSAAVAPGGARGGERRLGRRVEASGSRRRRAAGSGAWRAAARAAAVLGTSSAERSRIGQPGGVLFDLLAVKLGREKEEFI